jgi:hypothetical protein
MLPGVNLLDPVVSPPNSVSSYNRFNVLSEECLFSLSLSPISSSFRKRARRRLRRQSSLRSALKISRLAIFGSSSSPHSSPLSASDLGSEDPLTLPVVVNETLSASLLMDSGTSSQFIDVTYAERMNLNLDIKPEAQDLILADGEPSPVGKITHTYTLKLTIDQHEESLTFQVTKLAGWDLIVGKPWLRKHNPTIDWEKNTCIFPSRYCQSHCLSARQKPPPPEPKPDRITLISRAALRIAIARPGAECFVIAIISPESDDSPKTRLELAELSTQLVPLEYHDYLSIFSEEEAKALPPVATWITQFLSLKGGNPRSGECTLCRTTT